MKILISHNTKLKLYYRYSLHVAAIYLGIELFLPNSLASYKVTAVYHIDTIDTVVRSRLARIKQSDNLVIILHHYNLDDVLEIFKMVLSH